MSDVIDFSGYVYFYSTELTVYPVCISKLEGKTDCRIDADSICILYSPLAAVSGPGFEYLCLVELKALLVSLAVS